MMSTTFWIQFLGIIFGAVMMYFTFVKYKRKELKSGEVMVWFIGWILLAFVALKPNVIDFIIEPLRFHRRLDFFVVFGFFTLLGMGFYNYGIVRKLERKLEKFVRREAISNIHKK